MPSDDAVAKQSSAPKAKPRGRMARTVRSLIVITLLGVILAGWNAFAQSRDIATATGPPNIGQEGFFVAAAERPDIAVFYKGLSSAQRITLAHNIGRYDDPALAKLVGTLLGDFDADARAALLETLKKLVQTQPKAVADQMSQKGGFQQLAITAALRTLGDRALPYVADTLANADARPNSVQFLVNAGQASGPILMPKLDSDNADVRLAAADALGKLAYQPARDRIQALFLQSVDAVEAKPDSQADLDARSGFMAALAGLGDPELEPFFNQIADDPHRAPALRAQAALGLGKIGSATAAATLWKLATNDEPEIRDGSLSALRSTGDAALPSGAFTPDADLLFVAGGIQSPRADAILRAFLNNPTFRDSALGFAENRPALVPDVQKLMLAADPARSGKTIDLAITALLTTSEGRQALNLHREDPQLKGLIARRLAS